MARPSPARSKKTNLLLKIRKLTDMLFYTEWLEMLSDEVDLSRDRNVRSVQISSLGEGVPGRLEQQPQRRRGRSPRGLSVNSVQPEREPSMSAEGKVGPAQAGSWERRVASEEGIALRETGVELELKVLE